jgi:protease-4
MKIDELGFNWKQIRHFLLWIALPLVIGILISATIPQPIIGTIHLGVAIDSYSAGEMITQINYARQHPEVRGVVLIIDSPGGTVADTESVYQELLRLGQTKPVVTYIGAMAASGAYYLSVGTDFIISNPTSEVGNIGVIGFLPNSPIIYEDIISTGPYKLWGEPRDTFQREMEMVKQGFYQAVLLGRGDRLLVDPQVILTGRIWLGSEAKRVGVIDELGSQSDAFTKVAQMAQIRNFKVGDLAKLAGILSDSSSFFAKSPDGVILPYPNQAGIFLLYIPQFQTEN